MAGDVINMPTPLSVLADRIRAAYKRTEQGRQEWIEGTLDLAVALAEARSRYPADKNFSHWLIDNDLDFDALPKNERAALINMAANLSITRQVLQETKRISWQHIWKEEIKPLVHQVRNLDTISQIPENPAPQAALATIEPGGTHEKKSRLGIRHPFYGLERAEEVAAIFGLNEARTAISKAVHRKGCKPLWSLILNAIDAGFLTPNNMISRPPNLRTLFPGIPPKFGARFDLSKPDVLKHVRDEIMPIAITNREALISDPTKLEALLQEHVQRRRQAVQQAAAEQRVADALLALPGDQHEIIMYGTRLWPRIDPRFGTYEYDQLRAAIWYWRDFSTWAQGSVSCKSPASCAIVARLSVRWFHEFMDRTGTMHPIKKVFQLVHTLAGLYEARPEGECIVPPSPKIEGQW